MKVRFCGVRGSTPAPGAEFVGVGGNTSCVAITPTGASRPRLLLDAGTGIRAVTPLLDGSAFHGSILVTHLHWDHLQGLPFFGAGDRADAKVDLHVPAPSGDPEDLLRRAMSPPHFPIGPEGLQGRWQFLALQEGWMEVEGLQVLVREVCHKGGLTFGFRITDGTTTVAYLPDHLPHGPDGALALADGADVLIHDAQFVAGEEGIASAYGHSTVDQALALAAEAEVGELVLFHHSPGRTDEQVEAILRDARAKGVGPRVQVAREGEALPPVP